MTTPTLTRAIINLLHALLTSTGTKQRSFFRLDGFDEATYRALLTKFKESGDRLGDRELLIRTTGELPEFDGYKLGLERSPTWYRNNVPATHALVLINNLVTSDAQSLKDLFTIDEATLAHPTVGLDHLLGAAFQTFTLTPEHKNDLLEFVGRLNRVRKPQVRSLTAFFDALNETLASEPGLSMKGAIGQQLPHLGLFRCAELANADPKRTERLLHANMTVAALGGELLEPNRLDAYLQSIENNKALFEDESAHQGLTPQAKAALLQRFLTEVLGGEELRAVLELDWREIEPVLSKPQTSTAKEKRRLLGKQIKAEIDKILSPDQPVSDDAQEALNDLLGGKEPAPEHAQELLNELGGLLPKRVGAALARLARPSHIEGNDFAVDVVRALIHMLHPRPDSTGNEPITVTVTADDAGPEPHPLAAEAFMTLYGGLGSFWPGITWSFDALKHLHVDPDDRVSPGTLLFTVEVAAGTVKDKTKVAWQFDPKGPMGAAVTHLQHAVVNGRAPVPTFGAEHRISSTHINLERPHESLGGYHTHLQDLGELLASILPNWVSPEARGRLLAQHADLERAWTTYVQTALATGLLSASTERLLGAYDSWHRAFLSEVKQQASIKNVMPQVARAWTVTGPADDAWAVVPFVHPFKLHWWQERHRSLGALAARLTGGGEAPDLVDEARFLHSLDVTFGSSGAPAIVTVKSPSTHARYMLPAHTEAGYELFLPVEEDEEQLGAAEAKTHALHAAKEMARVLEDYIETYPFVRDGLEIYLVECRNVALPGLLAEHLIRVAERRKWQLKCTIVVHSPSEGAAMYRDVQRWVKDHEEALVHQADAYFPKVTLRVVEVEFEELMQSVSDTDVAILADVIGTKRQEVRADTVDAQITPLDGFMSHLPTARQPHRSGEDDRAVPLTAAALPRVAHSHLLVQYAAFEGRDVTRRMTEDETVQFSLNVSIDPWRSKLTALHQMFNWIICYDTVVDRYLLESNLPDAVQVIRYSMGIGPDRTHKLTVSSSRKVQHNVTRRLAGNLTNLIPTLPSPVATGVAQALVDSAKQVSGDIVLRAAGPGAYLNEILGMVAAKATVEANEDTEPAALRTWLYLDDFPHWFKGKIPDLLRLSLSVDGGALTVNVLVVETKCVEDASFEREARDAQLQVRAGASRLARVWAPARRHLDAPYWYDQLAQALAGTVRVSHDDLGTWQAAMDALADGTFTLKVRGETYVYCHNGTGPLHGHAFTVEELTVTEDDRTLAITAHHYARPGFLNRLRLLAKQSHEGVTEATWQTADERVPTEVPQHEDPSAEPGRVPVDLPAPEHLPLDTAHAPEPATPGTELGTDPVDGERDAALHAWLTKKAQQLNRLLHQYGFAYSPIRVDDADVGATIVRFKVKLHPGQELGKLQRQAENLARDLASPSIPFIDNVLGTPFVGIDIARELPIAIPMLPWLAALPTAGPGALPIILGQTPDGRGIEEDLSEFPHLLVAGATNSGKSVFLRNLVLCLIANYGPGDLQLLIVDPKQTDFSFFDSLPHLISGKIITNPEKARDRLLALVKEEMPRRQHAMRGRSLKIKDFNARFPAEALPPIVAIIDEYAQLLSIMNKRDREAFERDLMSLAAVARSTGIHLILATQRPSADVVTGTLKANLTARIAFKVASGVDSRIVLDTGGAENLLGRGDMLYRKSSGEVIRLQAPYLSEEDLFAHLQGLSERELEASPS